MLLLTMEMFASSHLGWADGPRHRAAGHPGRQDQGQQQAEEVLPG